MMSTGLSVQPLSVVEGDTAKAGLAFHLPPLLYTWPWKRQQNPFIDEVQDASLSWILGAGVLNDKSAAVFKRANLGKGMESDFVRCS